METKNHTTKTNKQTTTKNGKQCNQRGNQKHT